MLALLGLLAGCSGGGGAARADAPAASTLPSAGHYPVATVPPQVRATPTVAPGSYQVVAAGVPVRATLPGSRVVVTALGPDVAVSASPVSPSATAPGVLTVRVTAEQGSLAVAASRFLVLDEQQRPVAVHADRAVLTATPGHPAVLSLHAVFAGGHTTLTWRPLGKPLVTWDFVVELD